MSQQKIKLVKLLTMDGRILDKAGWMDFTTGVHDDDGTVYAAGFEADGTPYSTYGNPESGQILYPDGSDTGYRFDVNYISLVSLRVVHSTFKKVA
jgi:hypothetical protein